MQGPKYKAEIKQEYLDKLNWDWLSKNPSAIPLLERFPERINRHGLSANPNAIPLLDQVSIFMALNIQHLSHGLHASAKTKNP